MEKQQLNALSGLKYLLMLCILSCHYYNSFALSDAALPRFRGNDVFFHHAHLGVEAFFCISGFLMAYSVHRRKDGFRPFIARKLQRLYPLMIIGVFLSVTVGLTGKYLFHAAEFQLDLWKLLLSFTGTIKWFSNSTGMYNSPLWYVSVLIFCELVFVLVCKKKGMSLTAITGMVVLSLGLKIWNLDVPFVNESLMRGLCSYYLGVLLFEVNRRKLLNMERIAYIFSLCAFLILFLSMYLDSTGFTGNFQLVFTFLISPAAILACLYLKPARYILALPFLRYMGRTTYSMLATHMLLLQILSQIARRKGFVFDTADMSVYLLFLTGASLIGIISYELLEKRFIPWLIPKLAEWAGVKSQHR